MAEAPQLLTAYPPPPSPGPHPAGSSARRCALGLVQERWHPDPDEHEAALAAGIRMAAAEGARIVCLQELTLSPYFAITPDGPHGRRAPTPEDLETGPTFTFAGRLAGRERASTCTRRCTSAPTGPTGSATTRRSWSPPTGGSCRGPASSTSRSPPATTRTATSGPDRPTATPFPLTAARHRRRRGPARLPDVLGSVVPGARSRLLARGRRGADLPDGDRLRARPSRFRHPAAVAAGDRRPTGSRTARSWSPSTGSASRTR